MPLVTREAINPGFEPPGGYRKMGKKEKSQLGKWQNNSHLGRPTLGRMHMVLCSGFRDQHEVTA